MTETKFQRNGKYAICCQFIKDNKPINGLCFVHGNTFIVTNDFKRMQANNKKIIIVETKEEMQKLISYLSKRKRQCFRREAKKNNADMKDFRFYPIRLTGKTMDSYDFEKTPVYYIRPNLPRYSGDMHKIYCK